MDDLTATSAAAVTRMTGEIWNRRNTALVPVLYAADHIRHEPGGDDGVGFETARAAAERLHARFPAAPQVEHILVANGHLVFRRWSFTGIHHAPDGAVSPAPPMLDAMTICKLRDGLLAETWTTADWFGLDLQLAGRPFAAETLTYGQFLASLDDDPRARTAAIRAVREVCGAGDLAAIPDLFAPDHRDHSSHGAAAPGHDGLRAWASSRRAAFSELTAEVDESIVVAAGEWVAVPWTSSGRQTGPFLGHATTGREAVWGGQALVRVRDGQIVETWRIEDVAGIIRRLGLS
ncbi:MAG: ester cyclase [Thermomicrobiales bacterium]